LRREEERRGWREEEMDAAGKGGEARDLGGAGGSEMGVGAKSALNANHTASRTKLASHAQRANDVPVNFS
jgi:hypothetical protein